PFPLPIRTATVFVPTAVTARSLIPSPSRSPIATAVSPEPTAYDVPFANVQIAPAAGGTRNVCVALAPAPPDSVTVALIVGVVPRGMHAGAVQVIWLDDGPPTAGPNVPTFALQANA